METDFPTFGLVNKVAIPSNAPDRVVILPWGVNVRLDGKTFLVDEIAAKAIVDFFENRWRVDLTFDYEHHSEGGEFSAPDGKALAAGWGKRLGVEPGVGVTADVVWTPKAAEYIRNQEYRYLSPVVGIRNSDGRAVFIKSVTLTNTPMIAGFPAMVNKATTQGTNTMDKYDSLLAMLRGMAGLDDTADEPAVLSRLADMIGGEQSANALRVSVCRALEANMDADVTMVVSAFRTAVDGELNAERAATNRADAAEAQLFASKARDFIQDGERTGRVTNATRGMWLRNFASDPDQAHADLKQQPVISPPDGRVVQPFANFTPGGGRRHVLINKARAEFEREPSLRQLTDVEAHINGELRDAGLVPLTEDELKLIPNAMALR